MKHLLAVLALALLPLLALAAPPVQPTITWTVPTANSDGSTPANISGYNVYIATSDAALTALPTTAGGTPVCPAGGPFLNCAISVPATPLSYQTVGLAPGTYSVTMTTWYCAGTPTVCVESGQGPHVSTTIATPGPSTPLPPPKITVH